MNQIRKHLKLLTGTFFVSTAVGFCFHKFGKVGQNVEKKTNDSARTVAASSRPRGGPQPEPAGVTKDLELESEGNINSVISSLDLIRNSKYDSLSIAKADLLIAMNARNHPEEILKFLLEPNSEHLRRTGMPILFNVWVASDKKAALAKVSEITPQALRRDLELKLIHALAQQDPELTLDLLKKNKQIDENDGSNMTSLHYEAFLALAAKDPEYAMLQLSQLESKTQQYSALQGIASAMCNQDIGHALDWCASLQMIDQSLKDQLVSFIVKRGFLVDGSKTLEELDAKSATGILGNQEFIAGISGSMSKLVNEDFDKTFGLLNRFQIKPSAKSDLLECCFSEYCRQNPYLAIKKLVEIRGNSIGPLAQTDSIKLETIAKTAYIQAKAFEFPEQFREFIYGVNLDSSEEIASICRQLLYTQGDSFATFLNQQDDQMLSKSAKERYLCSWIDKNPEVAIAWAEKELPIGGLRDSMQLQYDTNMAIKDPSRYAERLKDSEYTLANKQLTRIVAGQLTFESPSHAAEWATNITDPQLYQMAVDAISKDWIRRDSNAASEWIRSLPVGESRNRAIRNLIDAIKDVDPLGARQWADSIGESKLLIK